MKNYIDSQEHWEDSVNADYDYKKAMEKEQKDNRGEQPDDRQQCYKTGEECIYKCYGLCKESC